eukprot:2945035-Karenia_brevis.AAC.1
MESKWLFRARGAPMVTGPGTPAPGKAATGPGESQNPQTKALTHPSVYLPQPSHRTGVQQRMDQRPP